MRKFKRKKVPDIEAFYLTHEMIVANGYPKWFIDVHVYNSYGNLMLKTASGIVAVKLPTWIIREPNDKGAYPCSKEYFAENFEEIEG